MAAEKVCTIRQQVADRIGENRFKAWFGESAEFALDNNRLCVTVPNAFIGRWIAANYLRELESVTRDIVGEAASVDVRVAMMNEKAGQPGERAPTRAPHSTAPRPRDVRPTAGPAAAPTLRGNLDSFVVGPSNQLAYSAARSLVDTPDSAIRPLFVHGGCGLGKTHLLQGICNAVRLRHPTVRWCYISGEEFTNDFISAVQTGRIDAFRARFRKVDLLVIDDIHFLANKKATQEEFLHTFNAIEGGGRTVVLSSDRHPRSIATLSEPLINRLIAGMVVEIMPPDEVVRLEIARRRAAAMTCDIPEPVLNFVATNIARNVRELEGAIYKLGALASLMKEPVTVELARSVLQDYLTPQSGPPQVAEIERIVCDHFDVTRERLHSRTRDRTVTLARAIAMYLVRGHCCMSYPEIGRAMGNKNHSTVVMAVGRVEQQIAGDATVSWKAGNRVHEHNLRTLLDDLKAKIERRHH